jgi:hypothetical protein
VVLVITVLSTACARITVRRHAQLPLVSETVTERRDEYAWGFLSFHRAVDLRDRCPGGWEQLSLEQRPWQISLQTSGGSHFCGGTIIGESWVCFGKITARFETGKNDPVQLSEQLLAALHGKQWRRKVGQEGRAGAMWMAYALRVGLAYMTGGKF